MMIMVGVGTFIGFLVGFYSCKLLVRLGRMP
jgi:hypothetical protein